MIVQCSVTERRHGSADRGKAPEGLRLLLLAARVRLRDCELTVFGLLTDRKGGPRCAL